MTLAVSLGVFDPNRFFNFKFFFLGVVAIRRSALFISTPEDQLEELISSPWKQEGRPFRSFISPLESSAEAAIRGGVF